MKKAYFFDSDSVASFPKNKQKKSSPTTSFNPAIITTAFQKPCGKPPILNLLSAAPSNNIPSTGTVGPANIAISITKSSGGFWSGAGGILTSVVCTNKAFSVGTLAIIREKTREMAGGVIKGWMVVQRRRVKVGAVFLGVEVMAGVIPKISLSLPGVLILSVVGRAVSHEDQVSEGLWTHGSGFLVAIRETMDNVFRALSANENVGGSGVNSAVVDFSISGRGSWETSKSRFISR